MSLCFREKFNVIIAVRGKVTVIYILHDISYSVNTVDFPPYGGISGK